MSEVIVELEARVADRRGRDYFVNVAGERMPDGRWEAWLEFLPFDDSEPLITGTETTQTTREDVEFWASGLTDIFLQGAFRRASLVSDVSGARPPATTVQPFESAVPASSINPFDVLPLGKGVLATQLRALRRSELLAVIQSHHLNPANLSLAWLSNSQLVTFIVTAAEAQTAQRR